MQVSATTTNYHRMIPYPAHCPKLPQADSLPCTLSQKSIRSSRSYLSPMATRLRLQLLGNTMQVWVKQVSLL